MGMTYNKTMNEFIADEKAKEEQNRKYFHDRLYPFLKNNNEFKKLLKQN